MKLHPVTLFTVAFGLICIAALGMAAVCVEACAPYWVRDGLILLAGLSFLGSALFAALGNH